jgi:hypothetical protein
MFWRGITHDLSKFLPSEFIPYMYYFYGENIPFGKYPWFTYGYYGNIATREQGFDFAWLIHQKRNRHHWQWWVLKQDDGEVKVFQMDFNSILEMVIDWYSCGKALGKQSPKDDKFAETRKWYHKAQETMILHKETKRIIEEYIGYRLGGVLQYKELLSKDDLFVDVTDGNGVKTRIKF